MKKITSLLVTGLLLFWSLGIPTFAEGFVLPINPSERYTDISFAGDEDEYREFFEIGMSSKAKTVYITVLTVLLVISVGVLIFTLKKAKKEKKKFDEEIKEAENEEIKKILNEYKQKKALRDELESRENKEDF